jgi:hypothetical protein
MRMRSIASRALLPGLIIGTCFAAHAAEAPSKAKEVRLTPFVLGAANSKAKPHVSPKNEQQALATKRYVENGIISMELPEDRTVYLVQVRNPDGSTRIVEEMAGAPESKAPAATEAKE